jgi:dipeptidase
MNTLTNLSINEAMVIANIRTTSIYLYEAVKDMDLESAKLELEELTASLKVLEEMKEKKEHLKRLGNLVKDMRKKGIIIDFANRFPLLKVQKDAVDRHPTAIQ